MFNSTKQGGKHRKQSANKGRVAVVAAATGAVSTAGFSGLVAGAITSNQSDDQDVNIELAADTDELQTSGTTENAASAEAAPQILAIAEYKPVENLSEQLDKAVHHSEEVARLDEAARAPLFTKPADGAYTSGFGARWGTSHTVSTSRTPWAPRLYAVAGGTVIDSGPAQGTATGSASATRTARSPFTATCSPSTSPSATLCSLARSSLAWAARASPPARTSTSKSGPTA